MVLGQFYLNPSLPLKLEASEAPTSGLKGLVCKPLVSGEPGERGTPLQGAAGGPWGSDLHCHSPRVPGTESAAQWDRVSEESCCMQTSG